MKRPSLPAVLAAVALLLSALYIAGLVADWPGWLRGSNWVWVRRVPEPGWRLALLPLALALGVGLAGLVLRGGAWPRRRTGLLLAGLVVLAPLLQLAVAAQHRAQPLSVVVLSAGGFWREGVTIDDPLAFAREHASRMPGYADVHVRTQPPGWSLTYWAVARGFERFPALAESIGRRIHRFDCLSPELTGLATAQLAAGSLRVVILALSGLGVLPLYAIGRRFAGAAAARLAVVGYGYLPALLVFSGRFDVAYALLALVATWLALRAVADGRPAAAVVLAGLVAIASFFTFTALAVAGLALLVAGAVAVAAHGWREGARRAAWVGAGVAGALLLFWGGLGLLGIDGLAMWRVGQAIHREYRLNYPAWFLFNLYDLAVFMGLAPFVGAVGAAVIRPRGVAANGGAAGHGLRALALGWAAAVLLLNLSATVRAETGRLWLFLMPVGLLIGLAWFAEWAGGSGRRGALLAIFAAFLTQALVMGFFLGGRAAEPATPPPQWRVPATATPLDYRLGEAVALRGYEVAPRPDGARLTLYWQAVEFPRVELSAFVHGLDAAGNTVAQRDGPPAAVPMWCWVPGEVVADERLLDGLAGGPDAFAVGLYDPVSGQRLVVVPPVVDDRIVLPEPSP